MITDYPITLNDDDTSLRGWFAGMALQGMLAHSRRYHARDGRSDWHSAISEEAYELADAMLKAREAKR